MRVLHVASGDLWAGAEVQAFTLISELVRLQDTEVAVVLLNGGSLESRLRAADVPVTILDEKKFGSGRLLMSLRMLIRQWKPHVVHTHRAKENILGAIASYSVGGVPSVRSVHGDNEHHPNGLVRRIRRGLIGAADRWCGSLLQARMFAVSADLAVRLRRRFPPEKVVTIENGVVAHAVQSEAGTPDFRAGMPTATHIGIVGRLVDVKRVDLFLRAASMLQREDPGRQWRFHVFGDGPQQKMLWALSEELNVSPVVTFHGHRSDIAACISGLDVIVMCSDHEGMPMTALEAAALKVPMVAHAVGGLTQIVPEELLVSEHAPEGYARAIRRALIPSCRNEVELNSARVLERYSSTVNALRVRDLYERVIGERRSNWLI